VTLAAARPAFGAELPHESDAAHPCRPTVSCTADLTSPGTLEVEVGAYAASLGGGQRLWAYPLLLKQTFTPWLQWQLGTNGFTVVRDSRASYSERRIDNVATGPKVHLVDQGDIAPSIALTVQGSLPTADAGSDGAIFTAHASKDAGPIHTDWNVGATLWWRGGENAAAQPFSALAFSATPLPPIGVALEGYVFAHAAPHAARDGGLRAAITLTPRPWIVFDIGGDVGLYPATHGHSLFVGLTTIPIVFWRDRASP
jgi:hypothetical protein